MLVIGLCLSGVFLFGPIPLFLCFRGGAVRFSFFWVFFELRVYSLLGFALLEIISYLSKKKRCSA